MNTNTEVKHTPGEWTFYPEYKGEFVVSVMSGSKIIADIMGESFEDAEVTKEEAKANAKLIAASPKMKEKLLEIYKWLLDTEINFPEGTIGHKFRKDIENLFNTL